MPTGYTAKLVEEGQPFNEFVMTCARAFGALVEMREESLDAEIPENLPDSSSSYHIGALNQAKERLAELQAMTDAEKLAHGAAERAQRLQVIDEIMTKYTEQNERIDAMVEQINAWEPPTPDHEGLKTFMLEQLAVSRNTMRYYEDEVAELSKRDPLEFWKTSLEGAEREVSYHNRQLTEAQQRHDDRNAWVRALRESLKATA